MNQNMELITTTQETCNTDSARGDGYPQTLDDALALNTPGIVGRAHPDTSKLAALAVMPRTGTQRRAVLDVFHARGDLGATDFEVQEALRMNGNTQRPRRVELVAGGWLVDSGERRSVRGHSMIVWKVAR